MKSLMNNRFLIKIYKMINRRSTPDYLWLLRKKAKNMGGGIGLLYLFRYNRMLDRMNSFIPIGTTFVEEPIFPHGIRGVFISEGAHIGANCVIFQQVTIGSNTLKDSKGYGAPSIGDNVYIGAGAKIIGGIKIGNNVRIGANCVVISDIPSNATVVLERPRVLLKKEPQNNTFHAYNTTDVKSKGLN